MRYFWVRFFLHLNENNHIFKERKEDLIAEIELCKKTFGFKWCFYYVKWANFEKVLEANQVCLIPSKTHQKELERDFGL